MKQILLVDDHPLLREGLSQLITAEDGLKVCGTAGNVAEAVALITTSQPDLVITDLTLPGRNGLEFIKDLSATHPKLPVIVLSMHDETIYAERVLRAGGRGYVMKDTPPQRLIAAIRTVLDGGIHASKTVTAQVLQSLSSRKSNNGKTSPLECLTDRELEVFELIGQAIGNSEIAHNLGISPRTLDAHRAHIREKLSLSDSSELTRLAIRWFEIGGLEC